MSLKIVYQLLVRFVINKNPKLTECSISSSCTLTPSGWLAKDYLPLNLNTLSLSRRVKQTIFLLPLSP